MKISPKNTTRVTREQKISLLMLAGWDIYRFGAWRMLYKIGCPWFVRWSQYAKPERYEFAMCIYGDGEVQDKTAQGRCTSWAHVTSERLNQAFRLLEKIDDS